MAAKTTSNPRTAPMSLQKTKTRAWLGVLSLLAVILLQGVFHLNGAFATMSKHAEVGRFSSGKTLHHVYMGYPVIDKMLALSVSFWDPVVHESQVVRLLSTTLSASLQSLGIFAMVESLRTGDRNRVLRWCGVNVFCWQYIGAAIFIPIYFIFEVESHFAGKTTDPAVPHTHAKALLPASVVTIVHLYRMVYFPPASITTSQHQAFMAVWQLAPFFCSAALLAIANCFPGSESQSRNKDARWVKTTYVVYGLLSAAAQLGVHFILSTSKDPSVSQAAAYIPRFDNLWQQDTAISVFVDKAMFFLQVDYIIIVIASGVYVNANLEGLYGRFTTVGWFASLMLIMAACHVFSLGFVYAGILYLREDALRVRFLSEEQKSR